MTDTARDRQTWNANAAWWDSVVGEADFAREFLIHPANDRLLALRPGQVALDVACGNGAMARRMARAGARVVAFDLAENLLELARQREADLPADARGRIDYRQMDAASPDDLQSLPAAGFDAAVCTLALMDMPTIEPLAHGLARVLRPDASFVCSITHPCFNSPRTVWFREESYRPRRMQTVGVKIADYRDLTAMQTICKSSQPHPHTSYHRPLETVCAPFFAAGFSLDALLEPYPDELARAADEEKWEATRHVPLFLVMRWRNRL